MAKKTNLILVSAVVLLLVLNACRKESTVTSVSSPTLPETPYNYEGDGVLINFSQNPFHNQPDNNQVTNEGATLGRVLFYDAKLSLNNTVACATCHKQQFAFADNTKGSVGFESKVTPRNSPAIINAGMSNGYFWDVRATTLEEQALMPVKNHLEMGLENMNNLEIKLRKTDYYAPLFEDAFGTPEITHERISMALAQFMRSMVSYRSKYDAGIAVDFANFSALEKMGKDLFFSWEMPCQNCHSGDNFNGWGTSASNIGLDDNYVDNGMGDLLVNQDPSYDGLFKIPSLRNVAVTAPYMHDGRFTTLEQVIDHYDTGVKKHRNLDYRLTVGGGFFFEGDGGGNGIPVIDPILGGSNSGEPRKLNLTETQKRALVAFMQTLTDYELMRDPKFSNPFTAN
jgi:cytochrome c peroxidase